MNREPGQFEESFLAESLEALDTMEGALLRLAPGAADGETINTIFRVTHSIKGGAGMLGFEEVASFAHLLETLLDGLRSGQLQVTAPMCEGLLQSVDAIRSMLGAQQGQQAPDQSVTQQLRHHLGALAAAGTATLPVPVHPPVAETCVVSALPSVARGVHAGAMTQWRIGFTPRAGLLANGNDPLRLFADLAGLGEMEVRADLGDLPALEAIDPAHCRIRWQIDLKSSAPREAIDLIFEWATGDHELVVERISAASMQAQSIRVATTKIDELLDSVDRIALTQALLAGLALPLQGEDAGRLRAGLERLHAEVRDLHQDVMRIRMLPVGSVFGRFPRFVHDLSARLGKPVQLLIFGEETELDRMMLEKIGDPLVHLVRNSIDHGIEPPAERLAAGKPVEGLVLLDAYHRGGSVHIVVCDDGRGLDAARLVEQARARGLIDPAAELTDRQAHELIFLPGFSTVARTTELSGRGVGMDVVRRNIRELGGSVELISEPGRGTTTTIVLPLKPGAAC